MHFNTFTKPLVSSRKPTSECMNGLLIWDSATPSTSGALLTPVGSLRGEHLAVPYPKEMCLGEALMVHAGPEALVVPGEWLTGPSLVTCLLNSLSLKLQKDN